MEGLDFLGEVEAPRDTGALGRVGSEPAGPGAAGWVPGDKSPRFPGPVEMPLVGSGQLPAGSRCGPSLVRVMGQVVCFSPAVQISYLHNFSGLT